ncbi:hypothetical protein PRIPAC_92525 [Pristionchus pacificus]|uniref:Uncharacterized protein n=1 Tax=Pristionchus pacificus TaxID=54126 RepID=A0A2A6CD25_PRIPA|nr:hypothetical protein PRIPAC_92525 [Pristionchus pacificus]|eukprot:PDM76102.1 hypothetical protein PRIPAC_39706 [Pristionchus pacificus]
MHLLILAKSEQAHLHSHVGSEAKLRGETATSEGWLGLENEKLAVFSLGIQPVASGPEELAEIAHLMTAAVRVAAAGTWNAGGPMRKPTWNACTGAALSVIRLSLKADGSPADFPEFVE